MNQRVNRNHKLKWQTNQSSSFILVSRLKMYWNPEHPPPSTDTRKNLSYLLDSSLSRSTHLSVRTIDVANSGFTTPITFAEKHRLSEIFGNLLKMQYISICYCFLRFEIRLLLSLLYLFNTYPGMQRCKLITEFVFKIYAIFKMLIMK